MEILLAIVVATAVIFFGALISMGNERQRRAIDQLREQTVLWAMQDLLIKRSILKREVHVDDPLDWFSKIASKRVGKDLQLQVAEIFNDPTALVCEITNGFGKLVFTTAHPSQIRQMARERRGRLSQYANRNPLLSLPRRARLHELSVLNSGILFDLELTLAWKGLAGQSIVQTEYLWMYEIA
jgi:hypothetical protein